MIDLKSSVKAAPECTSFKGNLRLSGLALSSFLNARSSTAFQLVPSRLRLASITQTLARWSYMASTSIVGVPLAALYYTRCNCLELCYRFCSSSNSPTSVVSPTQINRNILYPIYTEIAFHSAVLFMQALLLSKCDLKITSSLLLPLGYLCCLLPLYVLTVSLL